MKPIAHFSAAMLASANTFAGTTDVRYYLNGVNVRPAADGGVIIAATNGHAIFVCRDPDGWCSKEMIIAPCKALISAARKKSAGLFVVADNGTGMVIDSIQSSASESSPAEIASRQAEAPAETTALGTLKLIDGKFPDAARVMDGFAETNTPILVNENYIAQLKSTFSRLSDSNYTAVDIRSGGDKILARCSDQAVQAAVLIMGMSADALPTFSSEWLAEPKQEPKPKKRIRVVAGGKVEDQS